MLYKYGWPAAVLVLALTGAACDDDEANPNAPREPTATPTATPTTAPTTRPTDPTPTPTTAGATSFVGRVGTVHPEAVPPYMDAGDRRVLVLEDTVLTRFDRRALLTDFEPGVDVVRVRGRLNADGSMTAESITLESQVR